LTKGKFGWQGIIPSRAAKMGSIARGQGLTKLGTPSEFYEQLDPNAIAGTHPPYVLATRSTDIIDRVMMRHYPLLWSNVPPERSAGDPPRVAGELPGIVHELRRRSVSTPPLWTSS